MEFGIEDLEKTREHLRRVIGCLESKTYTCTHVSDKGDKCTWRGDCASDAEAVEKHDSQFSHHLELVSPIKLFLVMFFYCIRLVEKKQQTEIIGGEEKCP